MIAALTIIKYPRRYIFFALFAMILFRLPLLLNKKINFYKLLGSGKNGGFSKIPNWQQWAIFATYPTAIINNDDNNLLHQLFGKFILNWINFFNCQTITYLLEPLAGHGFWDGKNIFKGLPPQHDYYQKIAVLTRATIRLKKLKPFWQSVDHVASQLSSTNGFIISYGIGEIPFIKQATFSIWQNTLAMKNYAYQNHYHQQVIQKTRKQNWYSEEMFVRFKIIDCIGSIDKINPLQGLL